MSQLLKNYFVPLNLFMLAIGIFFIAHIITFQMGRRIEPPYTLDYSKNVVDLAKKEARPLEEYNVILERNIFNSRGLSAVSSAPVSPVRPVKEEKLVSIRLVGTVAGNTLYSFAIIEDSYQKNHNIFRLNDTIAPGIKLLDIQRNKITILRNGIKEEIEAEIQEKGVKPRVPSPPRPVSPPSSEVTQLSPTSFVVDRESIDAATRDMNKLLTQARLVPNFTGGVADGFRIFSIVPKSLFNSIGLRNGDIIQRINNIEMKEPEKAFQVYQMLKDSDHFVIDLMRAGQKMTLNYEVR